MPFSEIMQEATRDSQIPAAYAYAIMRTESAFDPEVHSPASAVGLMQLLPETATRVGEAAHLEAAPLEDARINIFLGVRYLAQVKAELKAPLALVAASYNAGPEAVQRWLSHVRPSAGSAGAAPQKGRTSMDLALFCELIPYGETRAYVFHVMESYAHYAYATGGESAVPRFSLTLPPL